MRLLEAGIKTLEVTDSFISNSPTSTFKEISVSKITSSGQIGGSSFVNTSNSGSCVR